MRRMLEGGGIFKADSNFSENDEINRKTVLYLMMQEESKETIEIWEPFFGRGKENIDENKKKICLLN